ncbi:PilW family protein [Congregibacter variabilis]|uniref:PilW family protein n=1 Tax=Congregibacter variabilis TaxID=3081200 RepID=A0ABZ0I1U3_9GAMM|nr:PilW family protein [Congregibacter sp. IMCC43200]
MEIVRRDLRQAGYFGCRQSLAPETPRNESTLTPGFIRNTLNPAPSGGSDPLSWDFDYGLALEGYTAVDPVSGGSGWSPTPPVSTLIANAEDHSDIVVTSRAEGVGVIVNQHPGGNPPGSASILIDNDSGIGPEDILMVTDCTSAAIFQVSTGNPDTSGQIPHNTGTGAPGNYTNALGRSFVGAEVFEAVKSVFYVANSPVTGRPALFRNGDELVEDVERLRVFYGVDNTDNRQIDIYVPAGTVPLDGPASTDPDWERVVAVQLHLLISSGAETGLTEAPVSLPFAGGTFDATDRRAYQAFTTTIGVRNRLP